MFCRKIQGTSASGFVCGLSLRKLGYFMSFGYLGLSRLNMEIGEFIYHKAVAMKKKNIYGLTNM